MDNDEVDAFLEAAFAPDRPNADVGPRQVLPRLDARCVGDDVGWRGGNISRLAALQTAGSRGSLVEWGRWYGNALREIGVHIGVLTETRICTADQHARAVNGLLDAGYSAVSHNVSLPLASDSRSRRHGPGENAAVAGRADQPDPLQGPRASGVILAVDRAYAGEWMHISRGPHGRALAGNIDTASGLTLRVLGLYGITRASMYRPLRLHCLGLSPLREFCHVTCCSINVCAFLHMLFFMH